MLDEARQACRFPEGLVVAEPHRRMTEGASFVRARGVHHVVVVFEIVGRPQKRMTIPTDRRENDRLVALQSGRRLSSVLQAASRRASEISLKPGSRTQNASEESSKHNKFTRA